MTLGIELGWANAYNIPIICLHRAEQAGSTALYTLTKEILVYADSRDMVKKISDAIRAHERDHSD